MRNPQRDTDYSIQPFDHRRWTTYIFILHPKNEDNLSPDNDGAARQRFDIKRDRISPDAVDSIVPTHLPPVVRHREHGHPSTNANHI